MLTVDLVTHSILERRQIFEAKAFSKGIIDLGFTRLAQLFDCHLKHCFLTRQMRSRIISRERHFHIDCAARHGADQTFFKARDEGVGTDTQRVIFTGTALKCFTVDTADEINHGCITVFDRTRLFNRVGGTVFIGDTGYGFINLSIFDFNRCFINGQPRQIDLTDFRHDLKRYCRLQIAVFFIFIDVEVRVRCNSQIIIFDDLAGGFVKAGLQHFTQHLLAITCLDNAGRNLARAEARHIDLCRKFGDARIHPGADISCRHGDVIFAFQAFGAFFGDIHVSESCNRFKIGGASDRI